MHNFLRSQLQSSSTWTYYDADSLRNALRHTFWDVSIMKFSNFALFLEYTLHTIKYYFLGTNTALI